VPCYLDGYGWLGSGGCYYGKDGGGFLGPNYWMKWCLELAAGDPIWRGTVWLASPPGIVGSAVQQAVDRLRMPKPAIAANPSLNTRQVVHVPVWWWIEPGWWRTRTASASVPGLTITTCRPRDSYLIRRRRHQHRLHWSGYTVDGYVQPQRRIADLRPHLHHHAARRFQWHIHASRHR
jgi:hypothetical protein